MVRIFVLGCFLLATTGYGGDLHERRTVEREVLNHIRDGVRGEVLRRKVLQLIGEIQRTPLPGDPSRSELGELLQLSKSETGTEALHPRYRPLVITAEQSAELNQLLNRGTVETEARSWITPGTLARLRELLTPEPGSLAASVERKTDSIPTTKRKTAEYNALPPVHPAVRWLLATLGMLVFVRMIYGRHTSH